MRCLTRPRSRSACSSNAASGKRTTRSMAPMKAAIDEVPYASAVKVGLQFKRRFWEEDDAIYGGISYTDLPIRQIAYPNTGYNGRGRAVLLGAYLFEGANAYEFTSLPPAERVARAVEFGAQLHQI